LNRDELLKTLADLNIEVANVRDDEINGYCPAHVDRTGHADRSPSWWINVYTGAHICFSCQYKGSLRSLVKYIKGDVDYFHQTDPFADLSARLQTAINPTPIKEPENVDISEANLDTFIENQEMVFMIDLNINEIDGKYNVANGFIAIASGSSIMLECINRITKHVNEKIITPGKLNFSGPGLLGKCINHYLGLPETSSFVNKEGKYGTLTFLKFEFGTEYVKNNNEDILFQNKNGNEEIIRLYEHECNKVKSVFWATAKQIIN
jgi:hypothetical protein